MQRRQRPLLASGRAGASQPTAEARERRSTRDRDRRLDSESAEEKEIILRDVKQMILLYRLYKQRIDNLAIIILQRRAYIAENVSSYILYKFGASLHVHVSTTCFILHAAYFILHVHVPTILNLLASQEVFIAIYI